MKKGSLIVIEGGDASGKATQSSLLAERLRAEGHEVAELDFPQYHENQVGALLKECLNGEHGGFMHVDARLASVLYATDRRESLPQIQTWLKEGKTVLLDRYTTANMLHQGAKIENAEKRSMVLNWIYHLEHTIMELPKPDMIVYLDVPASVRLELIRTTRQVHDLAETDTDHQAAVDTIIPDVLSMYPKTARIECVEEGKLKSQQAIAEAVFTAITETLN
jgi:dTMP kinase